MLRLLRNKKAQNTMEYALLIAIVVGAFTAMQLYTRRGLHARIKQGVDNIPNSVALNNAGLADNALFDFSETQYEPYYYREGAYNMTVTSSEGTEEGAESKVGGIRTLKDRTASRAGSQEVTGTAEAD